jgi:hypothetical protein
MPVTFHPAKHPSNLVRISHKNLSANDSALGFLESACPAQYRQCDELLQSSWENILSTQNPIVPQPNGFVDTIRDAYSNHHALSIRPDDIWIAILAQFNSFVNANSELLRTRFVEHEGQKELIVNMPTGNRYTVDFGYLSTLMAGQIRDNVKEPELAGWVIPKFSTTTPNDVVVSSVMMMSTMQKYFRYTFMLGCGLPSVTLEGERNDYEELLKRIEMLKEFAKDIEAKNPGSEQSKQLNRWYEYLRPVLSRFVKAFDDPHGEENLDFWQRVADKEGGASRAPYYSGWINAFCVFHMDGRWIGGKLNESDPVSFTASCMNFG